MMVVVVGEEKGSEGMKERGGVIYASGGLW